MTQPTPPADWTPPGGVPVALVPPAADVVQAAAGDAAAEPAGPTVEGRLAALEAFLPYLRHTAGTTGQ